MAIQMNNSMFHSIPLDLTHYQSTNRSMIRKHNLNKKQTLLSFFGFQKKTKYFDL